MIDIYQDYLSKPQSFTTEKMAEIHEQMRAEIGDDADALELYEDLMKAAVKYANMRAMWSVMNREEKCEQDALRTAYHNSVITHLNMVARYLKQQGYPAKWRDEIAAGPETEGYNRKAIGDFGCYLAFVSGVCAR